MKTTKRFEESATKLYNAFNEGTLNAFDCEHCGVGSLVEKGQGWMMHYRERGNIFSLKGSCENHDMFKAPYHKDYSEEELFNVEEVFLREWVKADKLNIAHGRDKEIQFNGLMAVLNYLSELDNIQSIEQHYNKFKTVIERDRILTEN
jgi:hypothetical protein